MNDPNAYAQVYLSGPMTGIPGKNFDEFNRVAGQLREAGWNVVNPAELHQHEHGEWRDFMRTDIKALVDCHAIYMLPGWVNSKGSNLEHYIARSLGLRIIYRSTE